MSVASSGGIAQLAPLKEQALGVIMQIAVSLFL
jgi:hypothetical protein